MDPILCFSYILIYVNSLAIPPPIVQKSETVIYSLGKPANGKRAQEGSFSP